MISCQKAGTFAHKNGYLAKKWMPVPRTGCLFAQILVPFCTEPAAFSHKNRYFPAQPQVLLFCISLFLQLFSDSALPTLAGWLI
jgi:hypothetical protein